jgi:anti-sigma B factor antagonist
VWAQDHKVYVDLGRHHPVPYAETFKGDPLISADPIDGVPDFSSEMVSVDGEARLILRGEIDLAVREPLERALDEIVAAGGRVVLDMREVSFLDSTGIGALARAVSEGSVVLVLNPQPAVRRALEVSGIDSLIQIVGGDEPRKA